jgi:hypothetical protein
MMFGAVTAPESANDRIKKGPALPGLFFFFEAAI